jgi:SAM-dependent methyltransferase
MSRAPIPHRLRARAARSPVARRLAGKPPLKRAPVPAGSSNASAAVIDDGSLWLIADRYSTFPVEPLGYGTVRDLADSTANLAGLAGANFDMKDMQRCWMLKAIVGNVPRSGRVLEIGAGEPLVAGVLSRLGYRVTVVDPYDGSGNGPIEYERFSAAYSDLEFVRDQFPPAAGLDEGFDAIYSISVLEHVPLEAIEPLFAAIGEHLSEGGLSVHAVDHVLAGWGAESHLEKLRLMVAATGLDPAALEAALERLGEDPDTYFVSAEAHNRWRGDLEYDQYPMRRISSVNLAARA